jgi:hypothetical protein
MVTSLLSAFLILSCVPSALLDFAIPKWKADPHFAIEDAYKWVYQATRGGEHAAPDRKMATQWLEEEWKSLGKPEKNEKLWEPLCRDGSIGRLNLRVYKSKGGREDDILDAFLASSHAYKEVGSRFTDAWSMLGKRLERHRSGKLTYPEWYRLDAEMREKNYPAIHHSKQFESAYHPAYRMITSAQKKKLAVVAK